jgi:hypothetical protein
VVARESRFEGAICGRVSSCNSANSGHPNSRANLRNQARVNDPEVHSNASRTDSALRTYSSRF